MGFDKQSLLNLMSYPNDISEQELEELKSVLDQYPYFQLGHSLVAKAKHDKQTSDARQALAQASVYAPNRRMLRSLFYDDLHIDLSVQNLHTQEDKPNTTTEMHSEATKEETQTPHAESGQLEETSSESIVTKPSAEDSSTTTDDFVQSDEVYNELEENLRQLRESKNQYDEDNEVSKLVDKEEMAASTPDDSEDQGSFDEQDELINRFIDSSDAGEIKIKPSDGETSEEDLSEASTHVKEDPTTENLAEIYVRQGKVAKAIEIYDKLILKYPEKKAYFAKIKEKLKDN